jgi:uncharacterized membrane protein
MVIEINSGGIIMAKKVVKKTVSPSASKSSGVSDEGRVIAAISYITWIGWIIAFLINMEKKNDYAKYHFRQSLLVLLIWIVGWLVFWIPVLGWILAIICVVLWVFGLVYAIQGEKKPIPLIGQYAEKWFEFI